MGFRLESDVKGLSSEDGYYTKDEYADPANRDVKDFISRFETLSLGAGDADPGRHSLVDRELLVDFESNVPEYAALYGDIKDGEFLLDGESYLTLSPKAAGIWQKEKEIR